MDEIYFVKHSQKGSQTMQEDGVVAIAKVIDRIYALAGQEFFLPLETVVEGSVSGLQNLARRIFVVLGDGV
jgi:hypothetical protein